ncbi:hypothetical protein [Streptomyces sp. NPDC126514]|uniref:hypothetical protein n=1 Tax=Streptomyces sp. NPDC126514 TaxID=3155210 RepID=UPI003327C4B6
MTDDNGGPVPRDLPDQQAGEGEDHWDVDPASEDAEHSAEQQEDVPDVDEAGTGRRGDSDHLTDDPEPEESTA